VDEFSETRYILQVSRKDSFLYYTLILLSEEESLISSIEEKYNLSEEDRIRGEFPKIRGRVKVFRWKKYEP